MQPGDKGPLIPVRLYGICIVLWISLVGTGMLLLMRYATSPGSAGTVRTDWPGRSLLARDPKSPTLVMVVHPKCVCTRASLEELAAILSRTNRRLRTYVLFLHPAGEADNWHETALWKAANRLPGVIVRRDDGGVEAGRFGARTSGHVYLYSASGRLLYSGGITPQRGHAGVNSGRLAVIEFVNGGHGAPAGPVFGCSTAGPETRS
jgi:hypothetical protein